MTEVIEEKEIGLFHKYPSIENSYRQEWVDKVKLNGYGDIQYCVTEKIHGSNTQIDYNRKTGEFEYCRRTGQLEPGEACYNVQSCFDEIKEAVVDLANYIAPTVKGDLEAVKVYGEIFGGSYPHPDVKKDNHASKVQKGVVYSPSNQWKAFDIAYTLVSDETNYFLCGEDFFLACNAVGIDTVPLLAVKNNLNEALEYPNDGESVVYEHYGLPKLEDNIMEGIVIKPWKVDAWIGMSRVIFKNKNERFKEKSHEKKVDVQKEVPEIVKQAMQEISAYATENRVNNIISHLGEVTVEDFGKILGMTAKDALEDYKKDYGTLNQMEKVEEKMVTKYLQNEVAKVVRQVLLK